MSYNTAPDALDHARHWIAEEARYTKQFQFGLPTQAAFPPIAFASFTRGLLAHIPPSEEREATWQQTLRIYTQLLRREARHAKHIR